MPKQTITQEIQQLRSMAVPELVERYEAVHGKPPRVKHKDWLWRRIAWKVQEQRFGGLSEVAKRRLDELGHGHAAYAWSSGAATSSALATGSPPAKRSRARSGPTTA